ncbi:hypothetical protein JXA84_04730 [candidate division WOR-3 bacterium]|nr:hypothetical protein [candidate division WOR-3 bacterium]
MVEFAIGILLILAVFSYFWREGFFFRSAELLAQALTLSFLGWASIRFFFAPQLEIASELPLRYIWFVLGGAIVVGEVPKFKKISKFPMSVFLGILTALLLEGIMQGFFIPQAMAFSQFTPSSGFMLQALALMFSSLSVLLFFVIPDKNQNAFLNALKTSGKVVLFFVLGVLLSGMIFTAATYLSGRVAFLFSVGRAPF